MSWTTDYRVSNVQFDGVTIGGVQSCGISANTEMRADVANGSIHPKVASLQGMAPVGTLVTTDIAAAINAFGLHGLCIDVGTGPFHSYWQLQGCEGPQAGSVHRRATITEGIIFARSLTVDHQGDAQLTYEIRARFDGTNDPVIRSNNHALPAAPNADAKWTMGRLQMPDIPATGTTIVEGKRQVSINFNAQSSSAGADSTTFDTVQSLDEVKPVFTISGYGLEWNETVAPLLGRSLGTALSFECYLLKRNTPIATLEHIRLAAQGLLFWDDLVSGSVGSPASNSFSLQCLEQGVNKPIVANTAIAHPA